MADAERVEQQRRVELGSFLRMCRARIAPRDLGLPQRPRRRTPGLRREEVAELIGVGVTWYTWLEQGRPVRPSAAVLSRLAQVFQLDPDERAYLFTLAGRPAPLAPEAGPIPVRSALQALLTALEPNPAHVRDAHWFVVAWNRAEALIADWAALPPDERHVVWNHFTNPQLRQLLPDWEGDAQTMLALFRMAYGRQPDDPRLVDLVRRLVGVSVEFRAWWPQQAVQQQRDRPIILEQPVVGRLLLERITLRVEAVPSLSVRVLMAQPASDAGLKLRQLYTTAPSDTPTGRPG